MRPADLAIVARTRTALRSGSARLARIQADVTAAELARAVKVSRTTLGDWEAGRKRPTEAHALAYARALAAAEQKAA